jgi:hypothetical protein
VRTPGEHKRHCALDFFMPTVREARNVHLKPRVNELAAGSTDDVEARLGHPDAPTRDLHPRPLFDIGT